MRIYVISDVHGKSDALSEAMSTAGLIDNHGYKDDRSFVIHIGDIANCVHESVEGDLECLQMVGDGYIDLLLIGNHEIPYFDPMNRFSGFYSDPEIEDFLMWLNESGKIAPAYLHENGTLVSHAGVTAGSTHMQDPQHVYNYVMDLWTSQHYGAHIFTDVGVTRRGRARKGGMLWCDFDEEFEPTEYPQIVGHTPGILRTNGNALCIDTGAKRKGLPTIIQIGG